MIKKIVKLDVAAIIQENIEVHSICNLRYSAS